jgi:hypothetical protein
LLIRIKPTRTLITLLVGLGIGAASGYFLGSQRARVAVLSGPYSDNYGPARTEMAHALTKLGAGDTNVIEHLRTADAQIKQAQEWTRRYVGQENDKAR